MLFYGQLWLPVFLLLSFPFSTLLSCLPHHTLLSPNHVCHAPCLHPIMRAGRQKKKTRTVNRDRRDWFIQLVGRTFRRFGCAFPIHLQANCLSSFCIPSLPCPHNSSHALPTMTLKLTCELAMHGRVACRHALLAFLFEHFCLAHAATHTLLHAGTQHRPYTRTHIMNAWQRHLHCLHLQKNSLLLSFAAYTAGSHIVAVTNLCGHFGFVNIPSIPPTILRPYIFLVSGTWDPYYFLLPSRFVLMCVLCWFMRQTFTHLYYTAPQWVVAAGSPVCMTLTGWDLSLDLSLSLWCLFFCGSTLPAHTGIHLPLFLWQT